MNVEGFVAKPRFSTPAPNESENALLARGRDQVASSSASRVRRRIVPMICAGVVFDWIPAYADQSWLVLKSRIGRPRPRYSYCSAPATPLLSVGIRRSPY